MATSNLQAELRELREQMNELKSVISREASRGSRKVRHRAYDAMTVRPKRRASLQIWPAKGLAPWPASCVATRVQRRPA